MAQSQKVFGGRLIGAAALAVMWWALPIVAYSLVAQANPTNADMQQLAARWVGKNQPLVLGIVALIAGIALFWDFRQTSRSRWSLRQALIFGFVMGLIQWINAITLGEHEPLWIVRTTAASLMMFTLIVFTRLIAQEVDKLEGNASSA